jgi:uncharacterized Ntn-hydrolase superfamily protein
LAEPLISTANIGHKFGPYEVITTASQAVAYAAAVGDEKSPDYGDHLAPMTVVAAVLANLVEDLGLYELRLQTVHVGQEAGWDRKINVGETIRADARLAASSFRRGNHFATISVDYSDYEGTQVGTSSTTIIVSGQDSE